MVVSIYRPTICVDFDGTIIDHDPQLKTDVLKPGVKEALTKFREMGFRVEIYSCRSNSEYFPDWEKHSKNMVKILEDNGIPFDAISSGNKPIAIWYIDDKAIPFQDNWDRIANFVEAEHNRYLERTQHVNRDSEETNNSSR